MPKLEPKQVQKELESGRLWPVYWIYGQERMKSRELLKRIRRAVLGEELAQAGAALASGFAEEVLEGTEVTGAQVVDSAQSLPLGGGLRLVIVRDAHAIRDPEPLTGLLAAGPLAREELPSVCVFVSKDLDGRKKLSKQLLEKAAVVPCEEVPEPERDAWIAYLAKRRGVTLAPECVAQLRSVDPWSLDIMDQEIDKFSLTEDPETLLGGVSPELGGEAFLEAFFARNLRKATLALGGFSDHPDESLPLLGLLAWNARYLALSLGGGERTTKLNPYLAERLRRWSKHWTLADALALQEALMELDFGIKQTAKLPLGLWTTLVLRFGRDEG
jgi:DNA polymerase-3 subunit delta